MSALLAGWVEMPRTFLYDLADEDLGETSDDLRDWLRDLLSRRLLDNLRQAVLLVARASVDE